MSSRVNNSPQEDSHISIPESFNTNQRQSENDWNLSYYLSPPSQDSKISIHSKVQKSNIFVKQMKRKDQELDLSRKNAECLQQKVMELEFNIEEMEKDLSEKISSIEKLNNEIKKLELKAQFAENPQLSEIWQRGVWLEENNQKLLEQLEQASEEIESRGNIIGQTQLELQTIQDSLSQLQQENKKLKSKHKKLKTSNKELKKLSQLNQEKNQDTELLKNDLKELMKDKIEAERNLKKVSELHKSEMEKKDQEQQKKIIFKLSEQLKQLEESVKQFQLSSNVEILTQEKEDLLNLNNQLNCELQTLRKTFIDNEGFGYESKYLNNNLTYSRSFSQTSRTPQVPHLNINKLTTQTSALEMAEVFLQESKINSSRLNSQRVNGSQTITSRQVRSSSLSINNTEFMQKKMIEQLKFDLDASMERENLISNALKKLVEKYEKSTIIQTKECEQKLSQMLLNYEELEQYVKELYEENLAFKSLNKLYNRALSETMKQGRINRQIYTQLAMIIKQSLSFEESSNKQIEEIIQTINQNINKEEFENLNSLIQKIENEALKKQVYSTTQVATVRKSNLQEVLPFSNPYNEDSQFNATGKMYSQRAPLQQLTLNCKMADNVENFKHSLKQRAKEVLSRRLNEIESILSYVEQTLLGEVSDVTVKQLQKINQRHPELVQFAQKIGKLSFALRDQYLNQRNQIIKFMNQGVSIVLQDFKKQENFINQNPKLQASLKQLQDQEWDYFNLEESFDTLWENLIIPNLQEKTKPIYFEKCTVPEVKQLFQLTISIAHGLAVNLNSVKDSQEVRKIKNSLESLVPHQIHQFDTIQNVQSQLSFLIQLLEELPESFFNSLILQHKSVHFCVEDFFKNIQKIFAITPQKLDDKQNEQYLGGINQKELIKFLGKCSEDHKNLEQIINIGQIVLKEVSDKLKLAMKIQDPEQTKELLVTEQIIKLIVKLNEVVTD